MTPRQRERLETTAIGALIALHGVAGLFRALRREKVDAAWHAGCALMEASALYRHYREDE